MDFGESERVVGMEDAGGERGWRSVGSVREDRNGSRWMIFGMGRGRTRLPSARRRRSHSSTLFIDGELFGWGLGEWLEAQGRAEEEKEGGVEVSLNPLGLCCRS